LIVTDRQEELGRWLMSRLGGTYLAGRGVYIGLARNGILCAVAGFEDYNTASIMGHLAVDGNRMDLKWIKYCFRYVFDIAKVNKLIGLVSSANTRAYNLNKKFGYIEEAIIKDADKHGDMIIMTMTKEQCKYI
jgi:hypothetical protein